MAATDPRAVNTGYFRSTLLVVLGLVVVALLAAWNEGGTGLLSLLVLSAASSYLSSTLWQLQRDRMARRLLFVTAALLAATVVLGTWDRAPAAWLLGLANAAAAAALLGSSMAAMLLGHYYLTAPWMTLTPLYRLLGAIFLATAGRLVVALFEPHGLFSASATLGSGAGLDGWLYWTLRWVIGIAGPLILTLLAWRTLKLRHTQAATGMLYVVVILAFLGEATGIALVAGSGAADAGGAA